MGKRLTGLAAAAVLAAAGSMAAAQNNGTSKVTITRDGVPAANVQVRVQPLNGAAAVVGTTGAAGELEFALSLVNKPSARFQVVVYDCETGEHQAIFVEAGADAPDKDDCRRTVLAMAWMRAGSTVAVDLTRGTVQTTGAQSFLGSTRGRLIAGGGAAAVGLGLLVNGGGDSNGSPNNTENPGNTPPTDSPFIPGGNYGVTNTVGSDPGGHRFFILMEDNTVLTVTITGTSVTITCPPGSKWTLLTGTFNPSTGQITAEGRGPAAGFTNVLFRFVASIVMSGPTRGAMTGTLTIGPNGELNDGPPITYNIAGARQ